MHILCGKSLEIVMEMKHYRAIEPLKMVQRDQYNEQGYYDYGSSRYVIGNALMREDCRFSFKS
jgi:hypothetical protein